MTILSKDYCFFIIIVNKKIPINSSNLRMTWLSMGSMNLRKIYLWDFFECTVYLAVNLWLYLSLHFLFYRSTVLTISPNSGNL